MMQSLCDFVRLDLLQEFLCLCIALKVIPYRLENTVKGLRQRRLQVTRVDHSALIILVKLFRLLVYPAGWNAL